MIQLKVGERTFSSVDFVLRETRNVPGGPLVLDGLIKLNGGAFAPGVYEALLMGGSRVLVQGPCEYKYHADFQQPGFRPMPGTFADWEPIRNNSLLMPAVPPNTDCSAQE